MIRKIRGCQEEISEAENFFLFYINEAIIRCLSLSRDEIAKKSKPSGVWSELGHGHLNVNSSKEIKMRR